jgi:hypothetical protein
MTSLIAFDDLTIEALTEAAQEAFEEVTWSLERTLKQATNFGRILSSVRKKIPHGQWVPWVESTFGDTISLRKIQRYMQIANASDQTLLEGAQTIDEALMRIAEPKRERKPSVEVVEPIEVTAKEPTPEKTQGETATNAVHREETRKAPAHRPPEKFTPVTPSYVDEDEDVGSPPEEPQRDMLDMFEDMKQLIRDAMHEFPSGHRQLIWKQLFEQLNEEDIEQW